MFLLFQGLFFSGSSRSFSGFLHPFKTSSFARGNLLTPGCQTHTHTHCIKVTRSPTLHCCMASKFSCCGFSQAKTVLVFRPRFSDEQFIKLMAWEILLNHFNHPKSEWLDSNPLLGGGFTQIFLMFTSIWGRWTHFDDHIFHRVPGWHHVCDKLGPAMWPVDSNGPPNKLTAGIKW